MEDIVVGNDQLTWWSYAYTNWGSPWFLHHTYNPDPNWTLTL